MNYLPVGCGQPSMHTDQSHIDRDGATIESMLTPLIQEHGADKVRDHLETLFGKARWSDYQRVTCFIDNIERRLERGNA